MVELIQDLGMQYPTENSKKKIRYGLYKCSCGKNFKALVNDIKRNHTKSCGCLQREKSKDINKIIHCTHKLSKHRLYKTWKTMIHRCNNPKRKDFIDYGGKGINVCERWLKVENFIDDMFPTFQEGLTLDRKENDKGYNPENCRWVKQNIQSRNTRLLRSTNTSGFRGVSYHIKQKKWNARITIDYKVIFLGSFNTKEEAARFYDDYIIKNNLEHTRNFA